MSAARKRPVARGRRAVARRRRGGPDDAFEREVRECARELALMRPMLLADFSAPALAAALAIHAVRSLAQCVKDRAMTLEDARELIERMMELKLSR